ncbi:MAG TPA: hypothetical protein VL991_06795 [Terracidiphilus sp.]|jgi:hypothetical protein|nr:hypothetical protein [Terracidiphilus sp.]
MRRGFSILLILFFGLGPLSATLGASEDTSLPACCRRHGAHHCALAIETSTTRTVQSGSTPVVSAPLTCPYYPGSVATIIASSVQALVAAGIQVPAPAVPSYDVAVVTAAAASHPSRTHAGRGPPSQI